MSGTNSTLGHLKGLELARYVLHKLKQEDFNIELLSNDFDNDERFINSILIFLKEIEWISEDTNGKYSLTKVGHANCLDGLKF